MTGARLITGIVVMAVVVPVLLFYLLHLQEPLQLITIALVTFSAWGIADLTCELLIRPRLRDRNPGDALRDWERQKKDGVEEKGK